MADHHSNHALPSDLDVCDPQFPQKAVLLNFQTQCEIIEIIAATKKSLDESKAAMTRADRILARK